MRMPKFRDYWHAQISTKMWKNQKLHINLSSSKAMRFLLHQWFSMGAILFPIYQGTFGNLEIILIVIMEWGVGRLLQNILSTNVEKPCTVGQTIRTAFHFKFTQSRVIVNLDQSWLCHLARKWSCSQFETLSYQRLNLWI